MLDIGQVRIAEMDKQGIDVQVLSMVQPGLEHTPGDRAIPVARAFNDRVAAAISAHPDRFAGFAALPTADPAAAADELARAAGELGFKGALVNGRTLERFLDDQFFWPIFEAAEALGVPIYLHPMPPPQAVYDAYYSGFGDAMGFMLARIDDTIGGRTALDPAQSPMQLSVPEYFERNFHITTSGLFTDPPLRCAIDTLGADKVMFSVDHPFSDGGKARRWIDAAAISDEERAKITHENAERLLGL